MKTIDKGIFYIISTPIGNIKDISIRGIETLKSVDLILCEDTRTSSILLDKYEIKTKKKSLHMFNEKKETEKIITLLKDGLNIGLISDAGTPLISDPGQLLVHELKMNGVEIISIPGSSAILSALVSSGLIFNNFAFLGFIPKEKAKIKKQVERNLNINILIYYESPKRIKHTLINLKELYGNIKIVVARELTKKFEEVIFDKIENILLNIKEKGEFVVLIDVSEFKSNVVRQRVLNKIDLINKSKNTKKTIAMILEEDEIKKNEIYKLIE